MPPQECDVKVGSYVVARRPGEPGSGDEDEGEDEGEEASPRGALRPRHHCYIYKMLLLFVKFNTECEKVLSTCSARNNTIIKCVTV